MSKNQIGNNLLYLLSEKKSIKYTKFKHYAEYLCQQNKQTGYYDISESQEINENKEASTSNTSIGKTEDSSKKQCYKFWQLARNLNSLAYLDIGGKTGETLINIAPPMLAEIPFMELTFLLTGARSSNFLKTIKKAVKSQPKITIEIKTHSLLPDTVFIKPESKELLKKFLEETDFQGNKLSDYVTISENPPAWNILEFAGSLADYEKSLKDDDWLSGDKAHIKKIFDIKSLKFKDFNSNEESLENNLNLVKIFHQESFYKYYLFSKEREEKVEVLPNLGKFLIMAKKISTVRDNYTQKTSIHSLLKYRKKTFELFSCLRLPTLFERGLSLLSGQAPEERDLNSQFISKNFRVSKFQRQKQKSKGLPIYCRTAEATPSKPHKQSSTKKSADKIFIFKNVPHKIALLVAKKLEQNLTEF